MQQFYQVLYTSISFQCSVVNIGPLSGYDLGRSFCPHGSDEGIGEIVYFLGGMMVMFVCSIL